MRILICTKRDLPANLALNHLIPALDGHELMVLFSDKTRPAELDAPELAALKFLERDLPNELLFPHLESGPAETRPCRTFTELGQAYGFEGRIVRSLTDPSTMELLTRFDADLILSIRFSLIFKRAHIAMPRLGILNLHPGALPSYGGLFAPMRQMLQGERHAGCTLHYIDEGIDTGPVVSTSWLEIDPKKSMLWHVHRLYPLGVDEALRVIRRLETGAPVAATPQQKKDQRYFHMPDGDEVRRFQEAGLRFFDEDDYLDDLEAAFGPAARGYAEPHLTRTSQLLPQPDARFAEGKRASSKS